MRERARDKGRLEDIIEYSNHVTQFIEGVSFEELTSNNLLYYAVMKNVEVVGEAAFMLTKAFKAEHPQTPWKMIESMRHILVHDYTNIIPRILWGTATNDIPELRKQVETYLTETDWAEWENGEDLFNDPQDAVYKSIVGMARNMRARGMSIEEIAEITGLSDFEILEL
ncbi:MAG: DUF86 domain-containing protein [Bacteroidales bacterium]|nr:DUF86 domain-containing protein [Bacteroidales bacterium]